MGQQQKYIDKPSLLSADLKVKHIRAAVRGSLVVTTDGFVYSTGSNRYGELGLTVTKATHLTIVENLKDVKEVHCGFKHTVFLTENFSLYGCGSNKVGQLGLE